MNKKLLVDKIKLAIKRLSLYILKKVLPVTGSTFLVLYGRKLNGESLLQG